MEKPKNLIKLAAAISKPIPYYAAIRLLMHTGATLSQASQAINSCTLNTKASSTAIPANRRRMHYFLDGMLHPYNSAYDPSLNPACIGQHVTLKQKLHGKYLLLLPCNSGAEQGNYFRGLNWKVLSKWFPERMTCLDFAATDSINLLTKDKLGLVVFENEMNRVRGYDAWPSYDPEKLEQCKELMRLSLPRLLCYKKIIVALNVKLYKETLAEVCLPNMIFIQTELRMAGIMERLLDIRYAFDVAPTRRIFAFQRSSSPS